MKFLKSKSKIDIKPLVENKRLKGAYKTFKFSFYFCVIMLAVLGIYLFFSQYRLQSPILLRLPYTEIKNKIISPVASPSAKTTMVTQAFADSTPTSFPADLTNGVELEKVANGIFQLESSSGKNDGCRLKGLFNGYGYRQNSFEWVCYPTQEEVRNHVINRIKELTVTMDLETAMCYYNTGYKEKGCNYYKNYLTIK